MKIVNFKKFVRSICIICCIIFILSIIFGKGTLSHKEVEYKSIYVSDGDTLWNIAEDLQENNDYYKNKDIRYIIADLKNTNNLQTSCLYIGQELIIPII